MWQFLIPAAVGALTNKGNPLKGAAIGAGLGAVGGAVLPSVGSLAGGAQAGAESAAGSGGGLFGSLFSQPGDATTAGLSKPGLLSQWGDQLTGGLDEVNKYAKPIGNIASAANGMQGLLGGQQPAAPMQMGGGQSVSQPIAGLLQNQQQLELERMNRRRGLLG